MIRPLQHRHGWPEWNEVGSCDDLAACRAVTLRDPFDTRGSIGGIFHRALLRSVRHTAPESDSIYRMPGEPAAFRGGFITAERVMSQKEHAGERHCGRLWSTRHPGD